MKRNSRLKKYVELFKRYISEFLADGVAIRSVIHPVEADGAVFEFFLNVDGDDSERIEAVRPSIGTVLSEIPQNMFGGDISQIRFGGTNLYLEGNRVVVIKGEDEDSAWIGNVIREDVMRVVSTSQGSGSSDR